MVWLTLPMCTPNSDSTPSSPSVGPPVALDGPRTESEGRVVETLDAGSYTYMQLALPGGGHSWVVTMGDGEAPGTEVEVIGFAEKTDFHSRRLGRTFKRLVFGLVRAR